MQNSSFNFLFILLICFPYVTQDGAEEVNDNQVSFAFLTLLTLDV
jgi:hypothetical protein